MMIAYDHTFEEGPRRKQQQPSAFQKVNITRIAPINLKAMVVVCGDLSSLQPPILVSPTTTCKNGGPLPQKPKNKNKNKIKYWFQLPTSVQNPFTLLIWVPDLNWYLAEPSQSQWDKLKREPSKADGFKTHDLRDTRWEANHWAIPWFPKKHIFYLCISNCEFFLSLSPLPSYQYHIQSPPCSSPTDITIYAFFPLSRFRFSHCTNHFTSSNPLITH